MSHAATVTPSGLIGTHMGFGNGQDTTPPNAKCSIGGLNCNVMGFFLTHSRLAPFPKNSIILENLLDYGFLFPSGGQSAERSILQSGSSQNPTNIKAGSEALLKQSWTRV